MSLLCSLCFIFEPFRTGHSYQKLEEASVSTFFFSLDLFQTKLDFNFQFRRHFPHKLVKGICQTLHFIHWSAEASFRPERTNLVEETNCFLSLAHLMSLIMTYFPLRLSPTAYSVKSHLLDFFLSHSQWVEAHRDWGRVIVTVPALGCPGVSRWDLTRHRLSSLPYSPDTDGRVGKVLRGEGKSLAADFLCFIQTFVSTTVRCPLSVKQPTLFYSTAQEVTVDLYFLKAVHSTLCLRAVKLNVFFRKKCFFTEIFINSSVMVFYSNLWDTNQDVSRGVLGAASLRTIK